MLELTESDLSSSAGIDWWAVGVGVLTVAGAIVLAPAELTVFSSLT